MPIASHELVVRYGQAVDKHSAALFIGAGLSMQAGLPSWSVLIKPLVEEIGLHGLGDLALAAEYYAQHPAGGRTRLKHLLAEKLSRVTEPGEGQRLITQLGVTEIWTTNFDPLLELAAGAFTVVTSDEQADRVVPGTPVVIKAHGSFHLDGGPPQWDSEPVITRGDFERYDVDHPRLWSLLQASYLTRTMLFLGFSFTDPNIELLLRLARRQGTAVGNHHLAVLSRPTGEQDLAEHRLRVSDLEANGITVCEISDFDELIPLLRSIKRRPDRNDCSSLAAARDSPSSRGATSWER